MRSAHSLRYPLRPVAAGGHTQKNGVRARSRQHELATEWCRCATNKSLRTCGADDLEREVFRTASSEYIFEICSRRRSRARDKSPTWSDKRGLSLANCCSQEGAPCFLMVTRSTGALPTLFEKTDRQRHPSFLTLQLARCPNSESEKDNAAHPIRKTSECEVCKRICSCTTCGPKSPPSSDETRN